MELLVATGNLHKLSELQDLLPGQRLLTPAQVGFPSFDVEEDGLTYLENALKKARALHALTGRPALADDSGISVLALGGEPGVRSARFGSVEGRSPLGSAERNALLIETMRGNPDRTCAFVCCLVLVTDENRIFSVQETCPGLLLEEERGSGGFGYDPIVYLPELGKTVAELSAAEKNRISHRGKAAASMRRIIEGLGARLGTA
jgi:XTP/dITP diphosphohydrolase